jgi:hypothetical protein
MPPKKKDKPTRQAMEVRAMLNVYANEEVTQAVRDLQKAFAKKTGMRVSNRAIVDRLLALGVEAMKKEYGI